MGGSMGKTPKATLSVSSSRLRGSHSDQRNIAKHNRVNHGSIEYASLAKSRTTSLYRRRASMERPVVSTVELDSQGRRLSMGTDSSGRRLSGPMPFDEAIPTPAMKASEVRSNSENASKEHAPAEAALRGAGCSVVDAKDETDSEMKYGRTVGKMTVVNPSGTTNLVQLDIEFDGCLMKNFTPAATSHDDRVRDDEIPCGDECIAVEMFAGDRACCFFAVLDGHGEHGHAASSFIRERLTSNVETIVRSGTKTYKESLSTGLQNSAIELLASECNVLMSGCSAVAVLVKDDAVFVANVGNSHCIVGYRENEEEAFERLGKKVPRLERELFSFQLTDDHVPDAEVEMERLLAAGAALLKGQSDNTDAHAPLRVYLPDKDVPGLALSRSMGDTIAATVGVISTPAAGAFRLGREYEYLVLATKGVWSVVTPDEAIRYVEREYRAYVEEESVATDGLGLSNREKRSRSKSMVKKNSAVVLGDLVDRSHCIRRRKARRCRLANVGWKQR